MPEPHSAGALIRFVGASRGDKRGSLYGVACSHEGRRDSAPLVLLHAATVVVVAAALAASAGAVDNTQPAGSHAARLAQGPLQTGIFGVPTGADADLAFRRTVHSGATSVRLIVNWRLVAPRIRPSGFRPADPDEPAYRWEVTDRQVNLAVSRRLAPIISILSAPSWAEGEGEGAQGTVRPDPAELGHFAMAAARRYSGTFAGLPRVRYWQVWNEPNLLFHLTPQFVGTRPVSAAVYRAMVNTFSDSVHSVHHDNMVVAGGLAPFTTHTGDRREWGLAPMHFMRLMLCMGKNLKPTCKARSRFDVWAHHPYTSGGPNHHAYLPDDVSLGDLPEMRQMLDASVRAGQIVTRQPIRFWVTEFSWDTSPPDPKGVPARTHARWVAEALYRMWSNGISLVTWFQVRDDPFPASFYQSGLYFRGATPERDRPKPALRTFRFPFVALPERGTTVTWGRTPTSQPGRVLLQFQARGRWLPLVVLRANRYGIFGRRLTVARGRSVRATYVPTGERSLPFRVVKTRDRPMFAFGTLPG
jgi:hypothetical protein